MKTKIAKTPRMLRIMITYVLKIEREIIGSVKSSVDKTIPIENTCSLKEVSPSKARNIGVTAIS